MDKVTIVLVVIYLLFQFRKINRLYDSKLKKIKGNSGEDTVNQILSKLDNRYELKYDVRIGHTQIDHIVINKSKSIIYAIETKNWQGKIRGNKSDDKWKQILGSGIHWYKNPVKQNEMHIRELNNCYSGYRFVNVVVFVGNDNIPKLKGVIGEKDLYNYIIENENLMSKTS
jgi:hypothetical protein